MSFSNNTKAGYSSIPDVDEEQGVINATFSSTSSDADSFTLAEKYPEANDQERAFLGALDSAIEKCSQPHITLPTFRAGDLAPPDSPLAFLQSLKYPTMALISSLVVGASIMTTNSPIYKFLFPYFSCILAFIATIPPIRERFLTRSQIILVKIKSQKNAIESKVTLISSNAVAYVDTAESFMDAALKPIKSKLDQVTELEKTLRMINPEIDIPDVTDIEEAFDGCTDKIRNAIGMVLAVVGYSTSKAVPKTFQSQESLDRSIFYPLLGVLLCIQIFGVWASTHMNIEDGGEGDIYSTKGLNATTAGGLNGTIPEVLSGTVTKGVHETITEGFNATNSSQIYYINVTQNQETEPTQMDIMLVSIQTYLTTMIQLILVYILSTIAAVTRKVNSFIKSIEGDVNDTLDKSIGDTFNVVFKEGLGGVRSKTLKLIRDMEKIEGPLKKAQEMRDYEVKMAALKEKALAEAEAKAREAEAKAREVAEKAKQEAEQKLREAREEAEQKAQQAKSMFFRKTEELKKKAHAEAEKKAQAAKEEAERKAKDAKEEAERKAQEAKEEALRKAEELEEKARIEAERKAQEAKQEAARKAEELKEKARVAAEKVKEEAQQKKTEAEKRAAQANALMKGFGKRGGFGF